MADCPSAELDGNLYEDDQNALRVHNRPKLPDPHLTATGGKEGGEENEQGVVQRLEQGNPEGDAGVRCGESSSGVKSGVACQLKVREVAVEDAKGKRWDGGEEDTEEHQVDLVDELLAGEPTVELEPEHRQDKGGILVERVEDKARKSNIAPMSMNKNQPRSKL